MNHHIRRRNDAFIRIKQFGLDNTADFPALSVGAMQFTEISAVVDLIAELSANQMQSISGARFSFNTKGIARENLRELIDDIAGIASSMEYEFPGISLKFQVKYDLTDAEVLAKAKAFLADAPQYKADFIRYELDADFMTQLEAAITAFEDSFGAPVTATDEQVAATAALDAAVRRGIVARNILTGVVKQKYKNNPGKLAAWKSASHIERTEKKDKPKPPTT